MSSVSRAKEQAEQLAIQTSLDLDTPTVLKRSRTPDPQRRQLYKLHEGLAPYLDTRQLRRLAAAGGELQQALRSDSPPAEVTALLETLSAVLRPIRREKITSPFDIASLLMVEMGHLDQEELRTVLLDTKNQLQGIVTVYKGSLNASLIRVGEIYKEALRRNSAGLIMVHNHPSGDPMPSPEDVLMTRKVVAAGELLDIECLDHLVIGQGGWISMREKGMFPS